MYNELSEHLTIKEISFLNSNCKIIIEIFKYNCGMHDKKRDMNNQLSTKNFLS